MRNYKNCIFIYVIVCVCVCVGWSWTESKRSAVIKAIKKSHLYKIENNIENNKLCYIYKY